MDPIDIALTLGGLVLFVWGVLAFSGANVVSGMRRATLVPLDQRQTQTLLEQARLHEGLDEYWLAENGFQWVGAFLVDGLAGNVSLLVWSLADEATFFSVYLITSRPQFDFVSINGQQCLSTATASDGQTLPTGPNHWIQTFSNLELSELWSRHRDACQFLQRNAEFRPEQSKPDLERQFSQVLRAHASFIRSQILWPLLIPYWFLTRRYFRHNKPIDSLYEPY